MAESVRSSRCAIVEQSGDSLVVPSGAGDFLALQAGFNLTPDTELLENQELRGSIAAAAPKIGIEKSTFSVDHYLKNSGTVATAPEDSLLLKSLFGSESIASTEYDTVASSTVSVVKVDTGEGATFDVGEALLVKHPSNPYEIRNIGSISSDDLTLTHQLNNAPGTGVNLGKAVLYKGADSGHPKLSVWTYLANGGAVQAASKMQVTSGTITIDAGQPIAASWEAAGLEVYFNPITITSSSKYIDFTTDNGTAAAVLTEKTYRTPKDLADEIATRMDGVAGGSETITCVYNDIGTDKGKFTITATGTTVFSLLWSSGTNTANSAKTKLGFSNSDDTGATTYKSDSVQSYASPYTPSYDTTDFLVAKNGELILGDASEISCADLQSVTFNIQNTLEDERAICAESGLRSQSVVRRQITADVVAYLTKYDTRHFQDFKDGTTTKMTINVGEKSGTNWVAGKCVNLHSFSAKISNFEIDTAGEYVLINLTLTMFTDGTNPEFFVNYI